MEIEVPQAIFPEMVFETTVKIPYDPNIRQVLGNGKLGSLNVGAVLVLPDGFQLAPPDRLTTKIKAQKLYFQPYSREQKNILVPCADLRDTTFRVIVSSSGTFLNGSTTGASAYEEATWPCGTNP